MKAWHIILGVGLLMVGLLIVSAMQSPLAFLGKYAVLANLWPSVKSTAYHAKAKHLEGKLAQATVDLKQSRKEAAQLTASAAITASTTDAQDIHINTQRADTARDIEVIHERIAAAPADCLPVDDPIVRQRAAAAVDRARAAQYRLQGAPQDGSAATGAADVDRLAGLGGSIHQGDWLGSDRLFAGGRYRGLHGQASSEGRYPLTFSSAGVWP